MPRTPSRLDRSVSDWLEAEGIVAPSSPGNIADTARVRALLIAAAREERVVSYSEMLGLLGHRFTRPKMRALCATLDAIDETARAHCEPGLAVLVVRESDGLPGQGWWTGNAGRHEHNGPWKGAEAKRLVEWIQAEVFAYWRQRPSP
ncbi:hypothetical protein [Erythrobacter litoralis]|nr:hypothetical protein [Erythrobacter litoralis]